MYLYMDIFCHLVYIHTYIHTYMYMTRAHRNLPSLKLHTYIIQITCIHSPNYIHIYIHVNAHNNHAHTETSTHQSVIQILEREVRHRESQVAFIIVPD